MAKNFDIFLAINNIGDEEIPKCVQFILNETGFNTKWTLQALRLKHILQIEDYFNKNYDRLSYGLLGSIYENVFPFKITPGHCALIESLPENVKQMKSGDLKVSNHLCSNHFSTVLKLLIESSENNDGRSIKARRFSEHVQYFSTYIYLMAGRACYETLAANMPMPQPNTILSYINKSKCKIIEGKLRCEELLQYLKDMKLELKVWMCEDGSGTNAKIEYDSSTNQLVGIVLPLHEKTGMPKPFTFLANTVEDIQKYSKEPMSSLVYVVLAQPLMPDVPPFILQIYGINNTFLTMNVIQRWEYTTRELKKYGIEVLGWSADGDSRLLSSMQYYTELNVAATQIIKFKLKTFYCLQDTVHIGTELRNRLLAFSNLLVFGSALISLSHLKLLINNVPKEVHGLVMKDICPDDRQNYNSLEKMMQARVLEALTKYVIGSEGTQIYLKLCTEITSSLIQDDLLPTERIYRLWHATFVLRAWKIWLEENKLELSNHFISQNAYKCIEINASNLISLTQKFRDEKMEELFMPSLLNSQPCEEIFRQFRSMGTMNYTRINFTLLELFHLVGRVELQNNIVYVKLADTNISFPRNKINKARLNQHKLPCDTEILNTINKAMNGAIQDVKLFGINVEQNQIECCKIKKITTSISKHREDELDDLLESDTDSTEPSLQHVHEQREKPNSFVNITLENGTTKTIRKSTYLWTLTDSKPHLSSDRLKRVQQSKNKSENQMKRSHRRLVFRKEVTPNQNESILTLCKNMEIQIGDWCIFEADKDDVKVFVLGNALSFKYIEGRTAKDKKYSYDFAPIIPPKNIKPRGIEVSASWFSIEMDTNLAPFGKVNSSYMNINRYVTTVECSDIKLNHDTGHLTFTNELVVLQEVKFRLTQIRNGIQK